MLKYLKKSEGFMEDKTFDDEILEMTTKKCPTCGAEIESDAQICPYCGAQIGESKKAKAELEAAPKKPIAPRPLKKGEKVQGKAPTQEYQYGDGYSLSALPLATIYCSWALPLITLIVAAIGVGKTPNPKDKKMFKISCIVSTVFLIVQVILVILAVLGAFTPAE